jgi:HD-GYP domain-containing protein (c-di-GMP phosphodiesterase class II)
LNGSALRRTLRAIAQRRPRERLTDEFTGARTLTAFRNDLHIALEHHERSVEPLTLALLEVDREVAIKPVADAAARTVRGSDTLYRIADHEFALVLRGTGRWPALALVQRLHLALAAAGLEPPARVTAGLAEAVPGDSSLQLIRAADTALLHAHQNSLTAQLFSPELRSAGPPEEATETRRHARTLATALARAVDAKDSYTRSHSETVAALCGMIGSELRLRPERLDRLKLAGLLHDVGKIGISDAILQKPGSLTDEEYESMKAHSTIGASIVSCAELDEECEWVRHHHERIDGKGYPDGLADGRIPLEARIIHVADAFEAMTSDRPYRSAMPIDDALEELQRGSGKQFDTRCVSALCRGLHQAAVPGTGEIPEVPFPLQA